MGKFARVESIVLTTCIVLCLGGWTVPASADGPLVFDEKIGHYKNLPYEALTDEGLSWEQRTRLFGGETVHYGELTDQQRKAKEKELQDLLAKIDMKLVKRCEADIRKWLDGQAEKIPSAYSGRDIYNVRFGAAAFFRAYEIFGDRKYLDAGLACADLILKAQWPKGHWPWGTYGEDFVRIQDGYNNWPFWIMLYAHKLTGDKKYLTRTAKLGDWIFATQLGRGKVRGWCQQYQANNQPALARGFEQPVIGPRTWNRFVGPMLTWLYATTGNERYRTLFEETYAWMRSVEGPGPFEDGGALRRDLDKLLKHYETDSEGFKRDLPKLRKQYPSGGWVYQYQRDGTPIFSSRTRGGAGASFRYDKPETWPKAQDVDRGNWRHLVFMYLYPHSRVKVQLDDSERVLKIWQPGGVEALRDWYTGPVKYTPEQYAAARLAAAKRCTDEQMTVIVDSGIEGDIRPTRVKYLEHVRKRWALPENNIAPKADGDGRSGLAKQAWRSIHCGGAPYRPPIGWAQWQYVWDVRLAQGKIDAATAATGGRGMETYVQYDRWDVQGDWTTRAVEVEDWMGVPLGDFE